MKVTETDLAAVLAPFNPWWRGDAVPDLPVGKRAAFDELLEWVHAPPAHRAVLLTGARQVGKTTLLLQVIEGLLSRGVPASNILYATFDHPLLKLGGLEAVLRAWREREPARPGPEYLFLDEAQFIPGWGTWVKHQVDFARQRRIVFTGSAMPLIMAGEESGVGRWHTIRLTTLSFFEYVRLRGIELPPLPEVRSLTLLFKWGRPQFAKISDVAGAYLPHFHEYLLRGGFPQTALIDSITQVQRLLREDVIDKVLKRDMTAVFGVRRVLELEQTFLYLCLHDGGVVDMQSLCSELGVKRPTAERYLDLLEQAHLVFRLPPFGYGKTVLRGRYKFYLADAALAPAVLLRSSSLLEDPAALGVSTETAVLKHLFTRYYKQDVRFTYWRDKKGREVDLIGEVQGQVVPFEVKYRSHHTGVADLGGLLEFCGSHGLERGYVVTRSPEDFGPMTDLGELKTAVMKIPAALLCYWMGAAEHARSASASEPG